MKKFMLLAATAALFAACSSEDDLNVGQDFTQPNGNPVAFDMTAGASTRGTYGSLTTDILKNSTDGFGVFGYYTLRDNYAENIAPNFMYNQQVVYGDGWEYSPLKYWPNETGNKAINGDDENTADKLSFFAYAPYTKVNSNGDAVVKEVNYTWVWESGSDLTASPTEKNPSDAGITALTSNSATTAPAVNFTVPSDPRNQIDLLWGVAGSSTYMRDGVAYTQASAEQIAGKIGVTLDAGADASANEMYGVIIYYSETQPEDGAVNIPWATAAQITTGTGLYTRSTSGVYTALSSAQVTAAQALMVVDPSSSNNTWSWTPYKYYNVEGTQVTVPGGLPMMNVSKQKVDDKLKFTFRHALSKIRFNIDTYVDAEDGRIALDKNTKVYVRAVKFAGQNYAISHTMTMKNVVAGKPRWIGEGRVLGDAKPFYFFDGLKNGAECKPAVTVTSITGTSESSKGDGENNYSITITYNLSDGNKETQNLYAKEAGKSWNAEGQVLYTTATGSDVATLTYTEGQVVTPASSLLNPDQVEIQTLNGRIIQGGAGVTNDPTNLLVNGGSLMVIPVAAASTSPSIEIVYDVETTDEAMSTPLTDQTKTGSVVENYIKKDLNTLTELTAGKEYIINIHLGLTSVKFDVDINDWQAGGNVENVELPINNNSNEERPEPEP